MRIDYLFFGYRKITPKTACGTVFAHRLLASGLSAKIASDGSFFVFAPSLKKYMSALEGLDYEVSGLYGLPGLIYKYRKRYGIAFAIVLTVLFIIFSSSVVWDVRIEGNESLTSAQLKEALDRSGLSVGTSWNSLSQSEVETVALKQIPDLAWININRRGTVAYVTVKEKKSHGQAEPLYGYSNIVAAVDCIIEEITVERGIAMVKAGDVVRRGQLLISGVIPAELGGGFVRAEGEIVGRVNEKFSVTVSREEAKRVYSNEKLSELSIKIFGFSLNIFKIYGNSDNQCVIIEDKESPTVLGRFKLPLEITKIYKSDYTYETVRYDDSELVRIAAYRLSQLKAVGLSDAELLKISSSGAFCDNGYTASAEVTVLKDIGEERMISN